MAHKNDETIKRVRKVGAGGFGTVYLGSYGEHKEVGIKDITGSLSDEAIREAKMLQTLVHPNIIRYINVVSTPNETSLIMEFIDGGSLWDYIRKTPQSNAYWITTQQIMLGVAYGMSYLHGLRIVHADLKSLNILLRHNYSAVICDFGLAKTIVDSRRTTTASSVGTESWFAPELCSNRPERNSFPSDVWAYGCVLLEVISQNIPWGDAFNTNAVLLNTLAKLENAPIFEEICRTQTAPKKLRDLLCLCCAWQKTDRPKFPSIVQDLSNISHADLEDINRGRKKKQPVTSDSPSTKPSPSAKKSSSKAASAPVTNIDSQESEDVSTALANVKLPNSSPQRKCSARRQKDDSKDQPTTDDNTRYDQEHKRFLYKGPRGGWYSIGANGTRTYIKIDSD